jgi:hypothetical protein
MNKVLEPYIGLFVRVFLDDFCVYGKHETHLRNLKQVFDRLVMENASLSLEKCCFGCIERILLGHIVSQDGICKNSTKIEKVKNLPFPKTKK